MIVIYVPCKNLLEAEKIGTKLIEEKLAICVNLIPEITSIYRWKGTIGKGKEAVMLVKTKKQKVKKVMERIEKLHSYKTPTVIAFSADYMSNATSRWLVQEI